MGHSLKKWRDSVRRFFSAAYLLNFRNPSFFFFAVESFKMLYCTIIIIIIIIFAWEKISVKA